MWTKRGLFSSLATLEVNPEARACGMNVLLWYESPRVMINTVRLKCELKCDLCIFSVRYKWEQRLFNRVSSFFFCRFTHSSAGHKQTTRSRILKSLWCGYPFYPTRRPKLLGIANKNTTLNLQLIPEFSLNHPFY